MRTKESFSKFVEFEFSRVNQRMLYRTRGIKTIPSLAFSIVEEDNLLILNFISEGNKHSISFPIPYEDNCGNVVIGKEVVRVVGSWFLVDINKEVGYWELMKTILTERIEKYFPESPGVGKRSQLEKILVSFEYSRAHRVTNSLQSLINSIVNQLPICDTPMQAWAMNKRVVFIDPVFDELAPDELLKYQKEKNKRYYHWTTIGMSDSTMVKNYMVKEDLRNYTPFGNKHHNPMRSLYQSLGMKGPDKPLIRTTSMSSLEDVGIARGCWNWFTAFIDLPLNFEDQLMVHTKHQDKLSTLEKRFLSFGTVLVKPGDLICEGQILSMEKGDKPILFKCPCEKALVDSVESTLVIVGGEFIEGRIITIKLTRNFKNGFKFTNLHGNKGIAVFCDTGVAYDEIRKKYRDIDIIVAAKTVGNRRNFGQVFEALATLLNGQDKHLTISDDCFANVAQIKKRLAKAGMSEDGTCEIKTPYGAHRAVCGWVAWGLLKEPENALWNKSDVTRADAIGIRISGNKVSHIEFRALNTIFGPGNHISKEILSYQEGTDIVEEYVKIVESSIGTYHDIPETSWKTFKIPRIDRNFLRDYNSFVDTVSDRHIYKDGVYINLPVDYYTYIPNDYGKPIRNVATKRGGVCPEFGPGEVYKTNKVYIPFFELRMPWQHKCGLWGTTSISESANNVLKTLLSYSNNEIGLVDVALMLRRFFLSASKKLSTNKGLIATHCLAVRYPNSAKATAAMSDSLKKNVVEIHQDMADDLKVKENDYVLVERFPCLGFMSMRVQKIKVTDDPNKKFVVTVSGASLNSEGLDFDGDTLYLLAFNTPEAKDELEYEFRFPNKQTAGFIEEAFNSKIPRIWEASLDTFIGMSLNNGMAPMTFDKVTPEIQAKIAGSLTSIKTGTGTSVALGYNLCRVSEGVFGYDDAESNAGVEMVLNKTANSVFKNKHRVTSLLERTTNVIAK